MEVQGMVPDNVGHVLIFVFGHQHHVVLLLRKVAAMDLLPLGHRWHSGSATEAIVCSLEDNMLKSLFLQAFSNHSSLPRAVIRWTDFCSSKQPIWLLTYV